MRKAVEEMLALRQGRFPKSMRSSEELISCAYNNAV